MKYKIFIASRSYSKYSKKTREFFEKNNCELAFNKLDKIYKEKDLLKIIEKYDGIVVGVDEMTNQVIKNGNKLKVIAKNGVGIENIDLVAADKAGIPVVNAPGTNTESVADLTVALMLSINRMIPYINKMTKNGHWKRIIGRELWRKKVGIIGTGDIGQKVAHRVKRGFDCEILAYDVKEDEGFVKDYNVKYVKLEELISKSDYISLHIPLNNKTKNLIDQSEFNLMKDNAYIINTARGGVINEKALFKALKEEKIAGAACDVFSEEPPGDNKLFEFDNFVATSHIGAFTYETNERTGLTLAKDIVRVFQGKKPINLVNKPR